MSKAGGTVLARGVKERQVIGSNDELNECVTLSSNFRPYLIGYPSGCSDNEFCKPTTADSAYSCITFFTSTYTDATPVPLIRQHPLVVWTSSPQTCPKLAYAALPSVSSPLVLPTSPFWRSLVPGPRTSLPPHWLRTEENTP
jgi:hypothetical protein